MFKYILFYLSWSGTWTWTCLRTKRGPSRTSSCTTSCCRSSELPSLKPLDHIFIYLLGCEKIDFSTKQKLKIQGNEGFWIVLVKQRGFSYARSFFLFCTQGFFLLQLGSFCSLLPYVNVWYKIKMLFLFRNL